MRSTRGRRTDTDPETGPAGSTSRDGDDRPAPEHTEDRAHRAGRSAVVERERDEHGGIKWGSAFFGFLTAAGVGVLVTALVSAAGTAVGLASGVTPDGVAADASASAATVGIVGGIILLVVLFVAYFCGGYVAGRMARFDGLKQGLAVWLWAVVVAAVVAILTAVAGSRFNVLAELNSFPRLPVSEGDLTLGGVVAAVALLLVTLVGAVLGGLAGMRFHRRVDRTGLGA